MSYIALSEVKDFLNVIHSADDDKLQILLNGAEKWALEFMNRNSFAELCETDSLYESDEATMPDNVRIGVYFVTEAMYHASPDQHDVLMKAAERLLMPHRCEMGI